MRVCNITYHLIEMRETIFYVLSCNKIEVIQCCVYRMTSTLEDRMTIGLAVLSKISAATSSRKTPILIQDRLPNMFHLPPATSLYAPLLGLLRTLTIYIPIRIGKQLLNGTLVRLRGFYGCCMTQPVRIMDDEALQIRMVEGNLAAQNPLK